MLLFPTRTLIFFQLSSSLADETNTCGLGGILIATRQQPVLHRCRSITTIVDHVASPSAIGHSDNDTIFCQYRVDWYTASKLTHSHMPSVGDKGASDFRSDKLNWTELHFANCSQSTSWRWRAWPMTRRVTGTAGCRSVQFSSVRPLWTRFNCIPPMQV